MGTPDSVFNADQFVTSLFLRYEENQESFELTLEGLKPSFTGESGEILPDRFDAIAKQLAHGYHEKRLPFDFCDYFVNRLFPYITLEVGNGNDIWPPLFWEVYLAFDDGEYRRKGDDESVDPMEKYTRPQIANIVEKWKVSESGIVSRD